MFAFNFERGEDDIKGAGFNGKEGQDNEEEQVGGEQDGGKQVRRHTLEELVAGLPLSLAYAFVKVQGREAGSVLLLPRRELWDVRLQLMAGGTGTGTGTDDDDTDTDEAHEQTVAQMSRDDVISGVYEGGFKTWECSGELSNHMLDLPVLPRRAAEIGCGTSLPAACLLHRALCAGTPLQLLLQDFNAPVLQLVSIANLYLAWHSWRTQTLAVTDTVTVTDADRQLFLHQLRARNITITAVSGPWSSAMANILGTGCTDLILTSETIYNTATLSSLVRLIRDLIAPKGQALVAAKSVYFGVGGGVQEFVHSLRQHGLAYEQVYENGAGIKTVILSVHH